MVITVHLRFLLIVTFFSQSNGQILSDLSPDALEDVYDIVANRTLRDRGIPTDTVTASNITYTLVTRDKNNGTKINSSNVDLINKKDALIILIHGWSEDATTPWYKLVISAYFNQTRKYSFLLVDYSVYSKQNYVFAAYYAQFVGAKRQFVGEFVVELIENAIPLENILVIGHSLGGQVAGFTGQSFKEITGIKLPKIVGLDPAGPLFELNPPDKRLDEGDATLVMTIHTNAGIFGIAQACGTIDFYPNGGLYQPGCTTKLLNDLSQIATAAFCSHHASWRYYAKTVVDPFAYLARKCTDWSAYPLSCSKDYEYMGNLETEKNGTYYVRIREHPYINY